MKSFKQVIKETTISRVWKHFKNEDMAVLIITAFRGENTLNKNLSDNKRLASDARKQGFGYVFIDGHWIEKSGNNEIDDGKEDSIMIMSDDSDSLHQFGIENMYRYNQDAIIFKPANNYAHLYYSDGTTQKLGNMSIKSLEQIKTKLDKDSGSGYSKLRNRGERIFVFESIRCEKNWMYKAYSS